MGLRFNIRNKRGAPWFSDCGEKAYSDKLRECLDNPKLTPQARALIISLLVKPREEVAITEQNGIVKIVCRCGKIRVTIQIEHPHRAATANAINDLAARLSEAPIDSPSDDAPPSPGLAPSVALSPALSLEARVKARACLGAEASDKSVEAKARIIELRSGAARREA